MRDSQLVYSTDPERNRKCGKCGFLVPECRCRPEAAPSLSEFTAVLRLETANRGGKAVTVVDGLPRITSFLEDLARLLKQRCGAGGTTRIQGEFGRVEIQGDKRELIRTILTQRGIRFKG